MPIISVIIPAYNAEKTIQETIESVLKQTHTDFELIVINDGSEDSTLDIVASIEDSRIKVFSYSNTGSNPSRNRGFSHARGDYLSFLDADDLWTPDKLEAQFRALQEYPQAAVAYSWTNYIDNESQFLRRGTYIAATGDVYAKLLVCNFLENGSNPLIRREAFTAVGGFDQILPAGQDWDIYLRLAVRYHFVAVTYPQVLYRVSANSLSTNVVKLEAACLTVIERAFTHAPESLQYLKLYSYANLYKYLLYKALYEPLKRERSLLAAKFLWCAVRNDASLLRTRVFAKVLLRISLIAFLPSYLTQSLLTKVPQMFNINSILGYIKSDLP